MSVDTLTADKILQATLPGEIFTGDAATMRLEYRTLAKAWHPDSANDPRAAKVMSKLSELYSKGGQMLESGTWQSPGEMLFPCKDGKSRHIRFKISHRFELGTMYIGDRMILYLIDGIHKDLVQNAKNVIKLCTFENKRIEDEIKKYLPVALDELFETTDEKIGLVIAKTPDLLQLQDVLEYYDGLVPARHVAWIMNRLYNFVCYLNSRGLSHNALSLRSVFISPGYHGISILGDWEYAVAHGLPLTKIPKRTYSVLPPKIKSTKLSSSLIDLELIRLIGRELLGDPSGVRLADLKVAPASMIEWLRGAASKTPTEEFTAWEAVLTASFGPRKFTPMELTPEELYSKVKGGEI